MKNKMTALLYTTLFLLFIAIIIVLIGSYPSISLPILLVISGIIFFISVYKLILKYLNDN
jgi:hypothetical protein